MTTLTMDTFYDDHTHTKMKLLKNKMTLDFNSPVSSDKMTKLKTCILESPGQSVTLPTP